ncbi:MAG: type IV pilus twitching motility protein PilT [Planctomycetes bacterium]|nr:type IV pilus twitching motility protein PilT [Planctomycetota bacterium]
MAALDRYLRFAVQSGASDLHLSLDREITLRLHGTLRKVHGQSLTAEQNEAVLDEVLTDEQRRILSERMSVDFCYDLPGVARFRSSIYWQQLGLAGVFRVLPTRVPTLAELGMPPVIERLLSYRQGLILVTGPAGMGKSTTLAAMIDHLNETRHEHIITVEDPIEVVHHNKKCTVTQREVHSHTESFANALRAALREDPDIIMIGEMRDLETVSIAITSAETGHLVLGTLHTPGAARTVNRMIDVFPPDQMPQIRAMVSESLRGVISQQLIPRADGKGRVAALEIMVCTPAIGNLIRENRTFQIYSQMQIGVKLGMRLMEQSLQDLVQKGVITAQEAEEHLEHVGEAKKPKPHEEETAEATEEAEEEDG